ncbi:MAG TPA: lipoyl(octanoyl) transferase LipB [Polyangia bacterium]|nr:lipoyl(octanoyl) transferase LipB [Polyangia bacterium]
MKPARVVDLSRREYGEVWKLQQELVAARQRGEIADTLVLVEHPDVITLGRRQSSQANVLAAGDIPVFEIERGGDVTYHGPGQLVGYPILALDDRERDLHAYLRNLEEGLIGVCADVGVSGRRNPGWTGVWIGDRKVASLGIAVRRWVTMHGFALNVATELSRFAAINPCGLDAAVMTSLAREAGRPLTVEDVKPLAIARLGAALGRDFSAG